MPLPETKSYTTRARDGLPDVVAKLGLGVPTENEEFLSNMPTYIFTMYMVRRS